MKNSHKNSCVQSSGGVEFEPGAADPSSLHARAACQLLERLRGRRSQLQLSRKLGFTSNVIYTWESGRRFPEVSNFFRIAELARVPVKERWLGFLGG
ncbi:MAG TPA: helix-turn-helix transcriptional regulator, partial [Polyangiaceae bacterium]|nr:helix-turn-helix transcriptional regulator [Polyangiaceae bacterium]